MKDIDGCKCPSYVRIFRGNFPFWYGYFDQQQGNAGLQTRTWLITWTSMQYFCISEKVNNTIGSVGD